MPALTSLVNPASAVITNSIEQPVPTTVSDASVALEEIAFYLGKLVKMSESLAVVDTNQRQRVVIENASSSTNFPVSVRNSNNVIFTDLGGNSITSYGTIAEFWKFTEAARQNYQLSIRSNLQFT
ncbi:hypothetical protein UFOVP760_67 [uncultured Caudovirales phage]|uniref:Uncharacterized protein n=1 Tax=uncultured Caudovirales phage TaxID=2100421 RepID=A0A6J7X5Z7_9CAUD|nr:hypothetical protein UFOVP760_67 [uncultured Caudovirales phage]